MSVLDGPGEGTWSVFASKVVEERDAQRERAETSERSLRDALESLERMKAERDAAVASESEAEALRKAASAAQKVESTWEHRPLCPLEHCDRCDLTRALMAAKAAGVVIP